MTDEELDKERAVEAHRLYINGNQGECIAATAARLAREGWVPVDPVVLAAREIVADEDEDEQYASYVISGDADEYESMRIAIAAIRKGMEMAKCAV